MSSVIQHTFDTIIGSGVFKKTRKEWEYSNDLIEATHIALVKGIINPEEHTEVLKQLHQYVRNLDDPYYREKSAVNKFSVELEDKGHQGGYAAQLALATSWPLQVTRLSIDAVMKHVKVEEKRSAKTSKEPCIPFSLKFSELGITEACQVDTNLKEYAYDISSGVTTDLGRALSLAGLSSDAQNVTKLLQNWSTRPYGKAVQNLFDEAISTELYNPSNYLRGMCAAIDKLATEYPEKAIVCSIAHKSISEYLFYGKHVYLYEALHTTKGIAPFSEHLRIYLDWDNRPRYWEKS